ncbi:MAG: collagen-binding protein [Acidobacteriales bacterium 59-55]|nr:TonB-dependent receptor [Terriglobales bacterium]OJV43877.1 MAG: collagen-binding protein [Acidobacteriales bacterium 59-55]
MEKWRSSLPCGSIRRLAGRTLLMIVMGFLAGMHSASAQVGTTASITGVVSDQTGAVIAGATITVTNAENGAVRAAKSTESGNYTVTPLMPGRYVLKVEKALFQTYEQQNIVLSIGQVAGIPVQMHVGQESQQVTVIAGAPVIQTEESQISAVVDSATIVNTPLNGRLGIIGLLALAPGVQGAGSQDQIPVYGVTPAMGTGARSAYGGVGYTLDGAINMWVGLQRPLGEVPPLDGIAEFKVITSGAPAEFSQPSNITVVSRGGTNRYHGLLVEFNRVAATAAKSYFAGALPKPKYIRNEFGGNFSGPISIPHLYNGKDRSFFFFSYEAFRLKQAANVNSQQPTEEMRAGNFSHVGTGAIKDPLTGESFPDAQIPSSRMNSVSVALQNALFPLPTTTGTGTNTFELVPYSSHVDRYSLRLDHKLNDRNQFRASYNAGLYGPNPSVGASSKYGGSEGIGERAMNTVIGWTYTPSSTLVTDLNAAYLHLPVYRTPQNVNTDFASIIPGLGPQAIEGAPQLSIQNITRVSEAGSKVLDQVIQMNGTLTKVLGRQNISTGFSYAYDNNWNNVASSPARGSFNFTGQYSGVGYADFLLGYPSSTGKPNPSNFITRNHSHQFGVYIADNWKVLHNLTINVGMRYDGQIFRDSPYGNGALYIPELQKIVIFSKTFPAADGPNPVIPGLLSLPIAMASDVGLPPSLFGYLGQANKNFAPRLGFAYAPVRNTVVRGAFGLYYSLIPDSYIQGQGFQNIPYFGSQTFSQPAGPPTITMDAPFAATGNFAANPAVSAQHKTEVPYTEEYNLALEHQFPGLVSFRVSYVGQHNLKQNNASGPGTTTLDLNFPDPAPGPVQPRRPVQPFAAISESFLPIFHSSMNSLQVGVHKAFHGGLMLNAEYAWTRVLGSENFVNPHNTSDSYGNIGGITPQTLNVSYSYELPFGHNRRFLPGVNGVADRIVSGWRLSGIVNYQSGQPFSVGFSTSVQGSVSGRADRVAGQPLYPSNKTRQKWFNTDAFAAPANFTYGNSAYNLLWGPRYQNWDMSLAKRTTLAEPVHLELRMDAFNVFNHPNFGLPGATVSNPSNFGIINGTTGSARTVSFGAKLMF